MKIGIIATIAAAATLAACAPVGGPGVSSCYDCGGGTRLKVDYLRGNPVMVQMNDNTPVPLLADKAASGAKYMSATHQFWDKGGEAMWTVGCMAPMTCQKVACRRARGQNMVSPTGFEPVTR